MTVNEDFQNIYECYKPKIYRYLVRLVGEYEAADLTQDVFVNISRALERFRGKSQLSTWIYRIATNAALDRLRRPSFKQTARKGLSGNWPGRSKTEIEDKDVWTGEAPPSVDQQLIREEMNQCIRAFIDRLPSNYRTALVLSELEELTNREIADILGISLHTVKIRLHRARVKLKGELVTHCSFYRNERNELACDLKSVLREFRKTH